MTLDLRDLSYFEAVAESETYDQAAIALGRTKQALTKSVKRLEAALGCALFERDGRGKRLSPVGEILLQRARVLRATAADIEREVGDLVRGEAGCVRIGAGTTPCDFVLPRACRELQRQAPAVRVELTVGMSDFLIEMLRRDEVDVVVTPVELLNSAEFDMHVVLRDEVVVAAGPRHPLVGRKFKLSDLVEYDWVLPSRSMSTRSWLDRVFISRGLAPPTARIETSSISALPRLVEEMNLLTFAGRTGLQQLSELPNPATTLSRSFAVLTNKGRYMPPAARRMLDILVAGADDAGTPAG